ncbi:hypothetical protein A2U01_0114345, partial [Trifolium medium]|nr:hypothetical protein [Trifolium medium]
RLPVLSAVPEALRPAPGELEAKLPGLSELVWAPGAPETDPNLQNYAVLTSSSQIFVSYLG